MSKDKAGRRTGWVGIRAVAGIAAFLMAGGCVEVSQMAAPERGLLGQAVAAVAHEDPDAVSERPFVGVTLEESLGSLDAMDFVIGLEVVKVDKGSPAAEVGVRVGDRIVEAHGAELLSLDQWQAVIDGLSSGDRLGLLVERDGAVSEVEVAFETARTAELPAAVRFVERWKARAEFETWAGGAAAGGDGGGVQVILRRTFRGSPLVDSGIEAGDRIIAFDGEGVASADELVRRITDHDFGDEVRFTLTGSREVVVSLWSPPRYLTRFQVPLLFDYERDPVRDELSFSFIDFWIFAIYDYRREAESRRHRLLYFFEYSSGVGELSDETLGMEDGS